MSHKSREKLDLTNRTKKIIGQLEFVLRGLGEDEQCAEVLRRLAAARGGINSLMAELMEDHILITCLAIRSPQAKPPRILFKLFVPTLSERCHDAINFEQKACQKKKNPKHTVPAYECSSAFRSQVL